MQSIASPLVGILVLLGIGLPLVFIVGLRRVALRLAGQAGALPVPGTRPTRALPTEIPSLRQAVGRLVLLTVLGAGLGVIMLRFAYGIGPVTNLSDAFPWGLWISFDVMSGVALAAGGFVIAATAHIFRKERFKPLVRPAILTALLGYLLVVAGLVVDLGRPYNIWRPLVHWQHYSVLWEVGLCVATYTAVLFMEFLPVILEGLDQVPAISKRVPLPKILALVGRVSILFVIAGVVLSTMHQSSLGSLWVLMPTKLHPLWYSIFLPVFFWMSAVAVGLCMTIVESTLSSRAFGRGLESDLLIDLGRAAVVVLLIYLAARTVDLIARDAWPLLFEGSLQSWAYWAELLLGILLPVLVFASPALRRRPQVLFLAALSVVLFGVVLNRLNVGITGMLSYSGPIYAPSWMEIAVTVTLVIFGVMAFGLAARHLPVFPPEGHEAD